MFLFVTLIFMLAVNSQSDAQLKPLPPPDEHLEELKNHPNWNLLPHGLDCGRDIIQSTYYEEDGDPGIFEDDPSRRRIFGGTDAKRWEFPWMVAFYFHQSYLDAGKPNCGGSIISRKYILTAGHCCTAELKKREAGDAFISVGAHNMSNTNAKCKLPGVVEEDVETCHLLPRNYRVESTIIPQNVMDKSFQPGNPEFTPYDDICLVRVRQKIDIDARVRPICLPTYKRTFNRKFVNKNVLSAGWGIGGKVTTTYPPDCPSCVPKNILQKAWLPVYQRPDCRIKLWQINVTENHYCVGGWLRNKTNEIRSTCSGDSGGPMFKAVFIHRGFQWAPNGTQIYFLFGITSYGPRYYFPSLPNPIYCGSGLPSITTNVSPYISWILDNLLEDEILDKDKIGDPRFTAKP